MIDPKSLQKRSLFGGLREDQIEVLLPFAEFESYEEGATIINEGDRNSRIRFIVKGRVEVVKNKVTLSFFEEGDEFGEMEALDFMPSAATVRALVPTEIMAISTQALHELSKRDPRAFSLLMMNIARDLSRRLRKMDELLTRQNDGDAPRDGEKDKS